MHYHMPFPKTPSPSEDLQPIKEKGKGQWGEEMPTNHQKRKEERFVTYFSCLFLTSFFGLWRKKEQKPH